MEQLKKKVRIVPMTNEYLNDVAELERTCFSNPWSRNMLAEARSKDIHHHSHHSHHSHSKSYCQITAKITKIFYLLL